MSNLINKLKLFNFLRLYIFILLHLYSRLWHTIKFKIMLTLTKVSYNTMRYTSNDLFPNLISNSGSYLCHLEPYVVCEFVDILWIIFVYFTFWYGAIRLIHSPNPDFWKDVVYRNFGTKILYCENTSFCYSFLFGQNIQLGRFFRISKYRRLDRVLMKQ